MESFYIKNKPFANWSEPINIGDTINIQSKKKGVVMTEDSVVLIAGVLILMVIFVPMIFIFILASKYRGPRRKSSGRIFFSVHDRRSTYLGDD